MLCWALGHEPCLFSPLPAPSEVLGTLRQGEGKAERGSPTLWALCEQSQNPTG